MVHYSKYSYGYQFLGEKETIYQGFLFHQQNSRNHETFLTCHCWINNFGKEGCQSQFPAIFIREWLELCWLLCQNNSSHGLLGQSEATVSLMKMAGTWAWPHGRMAGIMLLTAWHSSQQYNSSHSLMKMAGKWLWHPPLFNISELRAYFPKYIVH